MATNGGARVQKLAAVQPEPPTRSFVVPIVHVEVPGPLVNLGFFGGLAAAVAVGSLDLPLAALIGAGVIVARHRRG